MKFTIYTPRFNGRGGVIALYNLCRLLNEAGYPSAIWPSDKSNQRSLRNTFGNLYRSCDQALFGSYRFPLYNKLLSQPIASRRFLKSSTVVYPEIETGNPLNAQKIVRWILRTPQKSFLQNFSLGDGNVFYWREKFLYPDLGMMKDRLLYTPYYPLQIESPRNIPRKYKFCFIRHKNKKAMLVDLGSDALCLDGLSITEIVEVFRSTEYFVSYDLETGYTRLALLCGAIPIVVPDDDISKEAWRPILQERLGIAYGINNEEIEWAHQTRDLAIAEITFSCDEAKRQTSKFAEEVISLYS